MKKYLAIGAAALTLGVASQAMATADWSSSVQSNILTRTVYMHGGATEWGSDLGTTSGLGLGATATSAVLGGSAADAFTVSGSGGNTGATDFSQLNVAYYDRVGSSNFYLSSTNDLTNVAATTAWENTEIKTSQANSLASGLTNTIKNYASAHTPPLTSVSVSQTTGNSYRNALASNGNAAGGFEGYLKDNSGELNLAALDTTGYADIYLYHISGNLVQNDAYVVRTFANGSTEIMSEFNPNAPVPAPTPIPGTVLLMGSGLLGLLGVRRRENA